MLCKQFVLVVLYLFVFTLCIFWIFFTLFRSLKVYLFMHIWLKETIEFVTVLQGNTPWLQCPPLHFLLLTAVVKAALCKVKISTLGSDLDIQTSDKLITNSLPPSTSLSYLRTASPRGAGGARRPRRRWTAATEFSSPVFGNFFFISQHMQSHGSDMEGMETYVFHLCTVISITRNTQVII